MNPTIKARAEALCNLWGQDPNNEDDWAEAVEYAEAEDREKE